MQHLVAPNRVLRALLPIVVFIGLLTCTPVTAVDYPQQMKLTADGQPLTLLLRTSQVTSNLNVVDNNGALQGVPVKNYIGKIKGDASSWVRLTESSNGLEGIISRYGTRFRLQQSANSALEIKPLADNHDFRVSLTANGTNRPATTRVPVVTRVAKIAIAVDSKFNARHNGRGLEYALGLINSVDGIFREEFGLALQVETAINVTESQNDPFNYGNVAIEKMLRGFRDYRLSTSLVSHNVSLMHLFTGNQPADEPVGLAWIDTACRQDGYDVGLSTHYKHDVLLVAHEIAHNLGALHDSDTACAASTDKVMWPYISSSTTQSFSSCTIAAVKRSLASSCHAVATNMELAMSGDSNSTPTNTSTIPLREYPAAALAVDYPEPELHITPQDNDLGHSH